MRRPWQQSESNHVQKWPRKNLDGSCDCWLACPNVVKSAAMKWASSDASIMHISSPQSVSHRSESTTHIHSWNLYRYAISILDFLPTYVVFHWVIPHLGEAWLPSAPTCFKGLCSLALRLTLSTLPSFVHSLSQSVTVEAE